MAQKYGNLSPVPKFLESEKAGGKNQIFYPPMDQDVIKLEYKILVCQKFLLLHHCNK